MHIIFSRALVVKLSTVLSTCQSHTVSLKVHYVQFTNQYSVIVHDCIETMGDGQNSAVNKLFSQSFLYDGIRPETQTHTADSGCNAQPHPFL